MKRIHAEITIDAPASAVWKVITDFEHYHNWNDFTPSITLSNADFSVGSEFDLDCRLTPRTLLRGEREVILEIDVDNYRFCMGTSRTRGRPGITSYRWQICKPINALQTQFVNFEEFHGWLAPLVYFLYAGKLEIAFNNYCRTLKSHVEQFA